MPILYKNNPMPLDGALFVSNPSMRHNNAKDRFIRASTGKSLASIKALKKRDYEAYQDLFESAGGKSDFAKRTKSKKSRMKKFFAALPDGDTRGKRRGRKSSSSSSKAKGKNSLTQLGITLRRLGFKGKLTGMSVQKRQAKIKALRAKGKNEKAFEGIRRSKAGSSKKSASSRGKSSSKALTAADMKKIQGKTLFKAKNGRSYVKQKGGLVRFLSAAQAKQLKGKGFKSSKAMRKNPLVGVAKKRYQGLLAKQEKGTIRPSEQALLARLTAADKSALKFGSTSKAMKQRERRAATSKSIRDYRAKVADAALKKSRAKARGYYAKQSVPKSAGAAGKSAVKAGKVYVSKIRGKCKLEGTWDQWRRFQAARKAQGKKPLSLRQYYYNFIPDAINSCVSKKMLTPTEGKALIKFHKSRYSPSKKSTSTSKRRTSVAKKKSKRAAKKPMSLAAAARRGGIKKSIVNKIKKGTMLKNGEFRSAFKGCGYTPKQLAAKWKRYKASFGKVVAPKKRKKVSKKRKVVRAKSRGKKSASAISLTYVKRLLSKRSPKGSKTIKKGSMRDRNLKADLPKIQKYAARKMKEGKSKSAAVNLALTYYRSGVVGKKSTRRKGRNLRHAKKYSIMQRYNNPRRRKNAMALSVSRIPVVGSMVSSIKPFTRLNELNGKLSELVANMFGNNAGIAYGSVAEGLKMAEITGVHFLLGSVLDKPIDYVAAAVDNATGKQYASWLSENAYYSLQGLVALIGMRLGSDLDLFDRGIASSWGIPAFALGVAFDVGSALAKKVSDKGGVHLNGYGDGGQYMVAAPQTMQLRRTIPNPGYGALQMNPRSFGAVHANPGSLHGLAGAEGAMGPGGAQGSPGYGAVLFSGSGY